MNYTNMYLKHDWDGNICPKTCAWVFTAALFIVANNVDTTQMPISWWIDRWYIQAMKYIYTLYKYVHIYALYSVYIFIFSMLDSVL